MRTEHSEILFNEEDNARSRVVLKKYIMRPVNEQFVYRARCFGKEKSPTQIQRRVTQCA